MLQKELELLLQRQEGKLKVQEGKYFLKKEQEMPDMEIEKLI
ncbi:hypothetical protein HG1285_03939 [Hydrogenivirga sp. 128-5-R1-1]|nr:hypothetical protein HG1285_03939 [Hydrogenivirga sp. 128-5-R1-1]